MNVSLFIYYCEKAHIIFFRYILYQQYDKCHGLSILYILDITLSHIYLTDKIFLMQILHYFTGVFKDGRQKNKIKKRIIE